MTNYTGGAGNDNSFPDIGTGNRDDSISGLAGDDKLQGYGGSDFILGGAGNDSLYGNNAPGVVEADVGDFLYGEAGNDSLFGGDGDDYLDPGSGTNAVDGGAGTDTVAYIGSSQAVAVNLGAGTGNAGSFATDTLTGVENVGGTNFADTIDGNAGTNRISGFGGDDALDGGGGTDTATFLGDRVNYAVTRLSESSVRIVDNRTAEQIDADQVHAIYEVSDGTDTLAGFEFFRFKDGTYSLTDLLLNGTSGDDFLTGTEDPDEMRGFAGDDTISGLGGDDLLAGGIGDDRVFGGAGDDRLFAGNGRDLLDGGTGADRMDGRAGSDTYVVDDAGDVVVEIANAGNDTVRSSIDYRLGASLENLDLSGTAVKGAGNARDNDIRGNGRSNVLSGGAGDDGIFASAGRDRVIGGGGDDRLYGGKGDDRLLGGAGDDRIAGILGRDVMEGGTGEDRFVYLSAADSGVGADRDVIRDFTHGLDRIDLRKVDGDSGQAGNQKLEYIGNDGFSSQAGEFRTSGTLLSADLDGDGAADFQVRVIGLGAATENDFII